MWFWCGWNVAAVGTCRGPALVAVPPHGPFTPRPSLPGACRLQYPAAAAAVGWGIRVGCHVGSTLRSGGGRLWNPTPLACMRPMAAPLAPRLAGQGPADSLPLPAPAPTRGRSNTAQLLPSQLGTRPYLACPLGRTHHSAATPAFPPHLPPRAA
jgi:hypothetical protein